MHWFTTLRLEPNPWTGEFYQWITFTDRCIFRMDNFWWFRKTLNHPLVGFKALVYHLRSPWTKHMSPGKYKPFHFKFKNYFWITTPILLKIITNRQPKLQTKPMGPFGSGTKGIGTTPFPLSKYPCLVPQLPFSYP